MQQNSYLNMVCNSGASGGGLEYQNSEASQVAKPPGEVWRGRGFRDVEKPKEFIAFWHLAGLGLWAPGHISPPAVSCRLHGKKTRDLLETVEIAVLI